MKDYFIMACPFCGGNAGIVREDKFGGQCGSVETYRVQCYDCEASTADRSVWSFPREDAIDSAVEMWNNRV